MLDEDPPLPPPPYVIAAPARTAPLLLDGLCDAAEWARASRQAIGAGVELLAQQDGDFVYLCLRLPPESLGTFDLFLRPEAGGPLTNLHVSAQVGERELGPDGWPQWRWRNQRGWYGPAVPFAGSTKDGPDFAATGSRELQLARARFGSGPWRVRLHVHSLGADGRGEATFPAGTNPDDTKGWAVLTLKGA